MPMRDFNDAAAANNFDRAVANVPQGDNRPYGNATRQRDSH